MTDLSLADKYTDAFWRVVPIPLLIGVDVVGVVLRPSGVAVAAFVLVGIVGLALEAVICRDLRRRWAAGVPREAIGHFGEPQRPVVLVILAVCLWAAWTFKAHGTQGMSWGEASLFALILLPVYAGLIAVVAGLMHVFGHRG